MTENTIEMVSNTMEQTQFGGQQNKTDSFWRLTKQFGGLSNKTNTVRRLI